MSKLIEYVPETTTTVRRTGE